MSQLHKYPFDNAPLVYAHNQDTSVLATEAIWKRLGRTPIDKTKRIAVCEYGRAGGTLKYLLNHPQTTGPAEPKLWETEEKGQPLLSIRLVLNMLAEATTTEKLKLRNREPLKRTRLLPEAAAGSPVPQEKILKHKQASPLSPLKTLSILASLSQT